MANAFLYNNLVFIQWVGLGLNLAAEIECVFLGRGYCEHRETFEALMPAYLPFTGVRILHMLDLRYKSVRNLLQD